ncbi:MAG: UDP-N-acetylmuramoyl-L-alanyl-D-glutamate--2,6-diaminopimelate ligase [Candidatus Cloacimonadota bacterium]|nr:UDP-N-acetylmuramoyl-L-alanyl-D-glutamate--2,6-diaminopimelate ligase [Candidatus Cloacimonadota bacterium]
MKLNKLLEEIEFTDVKNVSNPSNIEISSITFDSRKVETNSLFVAVKGENFDGHQFVKNAIKKGASAIVAENDNFVISNPKTPFIMVDNSRRILAHLAAAFYGHPSRKMKIIGITGTDGKTTTATIIYHILKHAGKKTGLISTLQANVGNNIIETGFHTTTPDSVTLQKYLAIMVEAGTEYAIIETSSHGLAQYRAEACDFDVGVITNLTPEHLDYHKNIEEYRKAKGKLFQYLSNPMESKSGKKIAILNRDDESYDFFQKYKSDISVNYGIKFKADYRASEIDFTAERTKFVVTSPPTDYEISTNLLGKYNVSNILAAITVCAQLGIKKQNIVNGISQIKRITGRLDRIEHSAGNFNIFIDFAHTPNGLKNVLETVRKFTKNKVHVIFGCPGFRDHSKRKPMGEIAARLADKIYITADDPRTESLQKIMSEIAEGCMLQNKVEKKDFWKIANREKAIRKAILSAEDGDTVIACGKAHEKTIAIGTEEIPWDEYAVVQRETLRMAQILRKG